MLDACPGSDSPDPPPDTRVSPELVLAVEWRHEDGTLAPGRVTVSWLGGTRVGSNPGHTLTDYLTIIYNTIVLEIIVPKNSV